MSPTLACLILTILSTLVISNASTQQDLCSQVNNYALGCTQCLGFGCQFCTSTGTRGGKCASDCATINMNRSQDCLPFCREADPKVCLFQPGTLLDATASSAVAICVAANNPEYLINASLRTSMVNCGASLVSPKCEEYMLRFSCYTSCPLCSPHGLICYNDCLALETECAEALSAGCFRTFYQNNMPNSLCAADGAPCSNLYPVNFSRWQYYTWPPSTPTPLISGGDAPAPDLPPSSTSMTTSGDAPAPDLPPSSTSTITSGDAPAPDLPPSSTSMATSGDAPAPDLPPSSSFMTTSGGDAAPSSDAPVFAPKPQDPPPSASSGNTATPTPISTLTPTPVATATPHDTDTPAPGDTPRNDGLNSDPPAGMSPGIIAVIVVGVLLAVIVAVAAFFTWKKGNTIVRDY